MELKTENSLLDFKVKKSFMTGEEVFIEFIVVTQDGCQVNEECQVSEAGQTCLSKSLTVKQLKGDGLTKGNVDF